MDFSAPYRVISPTLEGPILRALAGVNGSLTRSQIVALVEDASEAGVRKAIGRLVTQGIVIEERIGSRYTYHVNRDHLLWPSVEGLFAARELLRERVAELVRGWEIQPVSVDLFGSVAQGVSDEESDVDVMVVSPELGEDRQEVWDRQMDDLHDRITLWTGNACDVVVMDPEELAHARAKDAPILRLTAADTQTAQAH
ncbi:MAG: nucleotidyltransferase domain-containing protein [Aeromicrobium sp.]|uniref:nucleotidyltransferase domain-containing protein n=1 Tax=Aeromicrobium sp. TaxID=1871063 RepID=UPI0039E24BBE